MIRMQRYHKLDEVICKRISEDRKNHVSNPYKSLDDAVIRRDMEKDKSTLLRP